MRGEKNEENSDGTVPDFMFINTPMVKVIGGIRGLGCVVCWGFEGGVGGDWVRSMKKSAIFFNKQSLF